jgi:four helix bundle protein
MEQGRAQHHEQLRVWKLAIDLVVEVYELTGHMPGDERFGLVAQMRRAAISVPSNIAEGAARGSRADFARFVRIARGSLAELDTHMIIAERLSLTSCGLIRERVKVLATMLSGLHHSLANPAASAD